MGDYFDQAGQTLDQGKAALLQAIATQGSQAHAALQAGQDQIAAAKQAAIQQALTGATQRGAQQPELDQLSRTVSQPYDSQLAGLASSAASRDAGFAQQGSAAGTYMDEARAGLPALRTELAQRVATLQAQARASEGQQQFQLEQARISSADQAANRDLERQRLQLDLAKAQQPDLGSIISKLGGADLAGQQLGDALSRADTGIGQRMQRATNDSTMSQAIDDRAGLPDSLGKPVRLPGSVVSSLVERNTNKQTSAGRTADDQAYQDEQRAEKQRQDALTALSVDPKNYSGSTAKAKDTDSSYGVKKGDTINLFQFANDGYMALMKQGKTMADANAEVQRTLERFFGHDYPQLRNYLAGVYGPYSKG